MKGFYPSIMHESYKVTILQAASLSALKTALVAVFDASKSGVSISWSWTYNMSSLQYEGILVWATNFQKEKAVY